MQDGLISILTSEAILEIVFVSCVLFGVLDIAIKFLILIMIDNLGYLKTMQARGLRALLVQQRFKLDTD